MSSPTMRAFVKYSEILTSTVVCGKRHPGPSDGQLKHVLWTPTHGHCSKEHTSIHVLGAGMVSKDTGIVDPGEQEESMNDTRIGWPIAKAQ